MTSSKASIFIVDDDLMHSQALEKILSARGYQVRVFESASSLLEQKHELKNCDLVISDIRMPGHSGYDLCRSLRAESGLGRIPVILITGIDAPSEKTVGIEAGADEFIGKPFDSAELLAKIRSLLGIRTTEVATLGELNATKDLNQRLRRLQRFLSPNVVDMLTVENVQPLLQPHRAEVTVFFVDLRRFTSFSERTDPEEVLRVLSEFYTAVGAAATFHNGTLGHLAGDGIMVFFNDPNPVVNHKETAVLMALQARASLIELRARWREKNHDLDFGMGLDSGEAILGEIGFEQFSQYSAIGPVANFASRLCSLAVDGQILASHEFASALNPGPYRIQTLQETQVKGFRRPVLLCNVLPEDVEKEVKS